MRSMRGLWVILLTLLLASSAFASEFSSPVTHVLDGDTIEVLTGHHTEHVRLSGIDCPEKGQAYGQRAKQAASTQVFGKEVTLQTYGTDQYGRTLGDGLLPDGTKITHELLKEGWCWRETASSYASPVQDKSGKLFSGTRVQRSCFPMAYS